MLLNTALICLAMNVYYEARGEGMMGKYAVAQVVMNRVEHDNFPDTVCEVVKQRRSTELHQCQFSWYCDGKSDEPVDSKTWMKSLYIADLILEVGYRDITEGSLYYHADYIRPYWADVLEHVVTIDNHLFYK